MKSFILNFHRYHRFYSNSRDWRRVKGTSLPPTEKSLGISAPNTSAVSEINRRRNWQHDPQHKSAFFENPQHPRGLNPPFFLRGTHKVKWCNKKVKRILKHLFFSRVKKKQHNRYKAVRTEQWWCSVGYLSKSGRGHVVSCTKHLDDGNYYRHDMCALELRLHRAEFQICRTSRSVHLTLFIVTKIICALHVPSLQHDLWPCLEWQWCRQLN